MPDWTQEWQDESHPRDGNVSDPRDSTVSDEQGDSTVSNHAKRRQAMGRLPQGWRKTNTGGVGARQDRSVLRQQWQQRKLEDESFQEYVQRLSRVGARTDRSSEQRTSWADTTEEEAQDRQVLPMAFSKRRAQPSHHVDLEDSGDEGQLCPPQGPQEPCPQEQTGTQDSSVLQQPAGAQEQPFAQEQPAAQDSNVLQQPAAPDPAGLFDFELLESTEQEIATARWLRPGQPRPDGEVEV